MILALATTGPTTELFLFNAATTAPERPLAYEQWASGRELADGLLGHIQRLCNQASSEITDLTGIVIMSGPGSFTSLRIGHTVANTLADSLGIPVVGASGEGWLKTGLKHLVAAKPGSPAWPLYGGDAHVTRPKT